MQLGTLRIAGAVLGAAGCAVAYEPGCPPPKRLLVTPAPTLPPGMLRITVVDSAQETPMPRVSVFVDRDSSRRVASDSAGRLEWQGLPPGRHRLAMRFVGYVALNEAFRMPTDHGVLVHAALAPAHVDGPCSGFAMPVKQRGVGMGDAANR